MKPFIPKPLTYFYMSRPAPCPYLPGQVEQMVFTDLGSTVDAGMLHDELSRVGFRRSQAIAYKPICRACNACLPARVDARAFRPSRSQRRVLNRNAAITGTERPAEASREHFELFARYVRTRHGSGGMAEMTYDDYRCMVQDSPVATRIVEFREDERLIGICLTDRLSDGLSLVYSAFEPELERRSLGGYAILWHLRQAELLDLDFVYLGYWIENSPKMAYKSRYRPLEIYRDGRWRRYDDEAADDDG